MAEIKQLIRETNPPAGSPRIPVPQIYDDVQEGPSTVRGRHGIPGAVLYGPDGNPLSQVATESTLTTAVDRLNAILTRLEGTLDVNVGGQIHADIDLGDVTVDIAEVQQGARGPNAEPWEVQLTGSSVPMRYLVIDYGDVEVAGRYNIFGSSFSSTTSGSQRDSRSMLDVSLYRKVMIRIENKSDNAVSVGDIYFGSEPDSVFGDSVRSISLSDIPALATVWLTPWEGDDVVYMPELASGFPSLGMWSWPSSNRWGTVNVKVWGWN